MLIHVYLKDNFVLTILIKHNIDDCFFNLNIFPIPKHLCFINAVIFFFYKSRKESRKELLKHGVLYY